MPTKQEYERTRQDIEQAIDTLRAFTSENETSSIPTIEPFDLKNGRLELLNRTSLEKTLNFVQTFSPLYRAKQKEKRKLIAVTLQESVDLVKIYSSALNHMQKSDEALAKKLVLAVSSYNAMVRQARKNPDSLTSKLKRFFFDIAGWKIDDSIIDSEIHIPQTVEFTGHRVTIQKESRLTALIQTVHKSPEPIHLKKEEIDAFRLKALNLLKNEDNLDEMMQLVHQSEIESEKIQGSHAYATTVIALHQIIRPYPGQEISITGEFQRDTFHPELCFPIKDSFKLHTRSSQSGFPHPLQYIGFCLPEKLLPTFLLRPRALPELQNLLEKKYSISKELSQNSHSLKRAKSQFYKRKALFNENVILMVKLQEVLDALFKAQEEILDCQFFEHVFKQAKPFDYISHIHAEVIEKVLSEPLDTLQREWLFNSNPEISDQSFCKSILEKAIQKAATTLSSKDPICIDYQISLAKCLAPAIANIYLMQLSEHLGFICNRLASFEMKLLTSLFRQQLVFANELLDVSDITVEYLQNQLNAEKSLFCQSPSQDHLSQAAAQLACDLVDYFM